MCHEIFYALMAFVAFVVFIFSAGFTLFVALSSFISYFK